MTSTLVDLSPISAGEQPAVLSVILGLPDQDAEGVLAVVASLRTQSLAGKMEIIIVAVQSAISQLAHCDADGFQALRIIPVEFVDGWAGAMARGIQEASAEIVVLAEDHAFPDSGWAEAILQGYQSGCAAVAPVFENANPRTGLSWSHLLLDYGRWLSGNQAGEREVLPGHNGSYRRSVLLPLGTQRLCHLLSPHGSLHSELQKQNHRLFLQSNAVVRHQHPSRIGPSIVLRFNAGRMLGAGRAAGFGWGRPRCIAYAFAAPLLYFMRWRYVLESLRLAGRKQVLQPRVAGMLALSLIVGTFGEAIGYLLGPGEAADRLVEEEFHRLSKMSARDAAEARRDTALPAVSSMRKKNAKTPV
jgi:hypothetical protein